MNDLACPPIGSAAESQLRQARAELEKGLCAGVPSRAEKFFALYPLLAAQPDWAVDLIYAEFATREELGQQPTREEYYLRFPHWKNQLERQFFVHEWLRNTLPEEALPDTVSPEALPETTLEEERRWLGHYELLEEIARGGCGRVYRAWQHGLERPVAVKVLLPRFSCSRPARERFCREASLMAKLRHPNIMPVHDIGECHGTIYFSMDYLPGGSLATELAAAQTDLSGAGIAPRGGARWLETVARAVHFAHQQRVIHRDLKPSNILLDVQGQPVVSDFGLARLPTGERGGVSVDLAEMGVEEIVGTPAYMAPEQLPGSDQPIGPATDVWALGVILYEILTGRKPFPAEDFTALCHQIRAREPVPLWALCPWLDSRLERICRKCLAKNPAARYPSAKDLADELGRFLASAEVAGS
jgi:serine/threonine protein kinase